MLVDPLLNIVGIANLDETLIPGVLLSFKDVDMARASFFFIQGTTKGVAELGDS